MKKLGSGAGRAKPGGLAPGRVDWRTLPRLRFLTTTFEPAPAPEPEPEPEPDAGNSVVDGGSVDIGAPDISTESGDLGPEETSLPSSTDGFGADTASSGGSTGGSSGGCSGGGPDVSWLMGLLAFALMVRSRRRAH